MALSPRGIITSSRGGKPPRNIYIYQDFKLTKEWPKSKNTSDRQQTIGYKEVKRPSARNLTAFYTYRKPELRILCGSI